MLGCWLLVAGCWCAQYQTSKWWARAITKWWRELVHVRILVFNHGVQSLHGKHKNTKNEKIGQKEENSTGSRREPKKESLASRGSDWEGACWQLAAGAGAF